MKLLKLVTFFLILYLYIFNPILRIGMSGFGLIKVLYPFILFFIVFPASIKMLLNFRKELLLLLLIVFVNFVHYAFGGDIVYVYNWVVNLIELFFLPMILALLYKMWFPTSKPPIMMLILGIAVLGSCISAIAFFVPEFSSFLRINTMAVDSKMFDVEFRLFGFASGLLYTYPVILGICVGYCLYKSAFIYYLISLLLLFAISINARVGFAPVVIAIFVLLVCFRKYKIIPLLIAFSCMAFFLYEFLSVNYEDTAVWIADFWFQMLNLVGGSNNESSTFDALQRMIVLPNYGMEWFFGTGENIFGVYGKSSDIGYVIQFYFGGILYCLLLYYFVYSIYQKYVNLRVDKFVTTILFLTIIIANYKGNIINTNEVFRFMMFYCFISVPNCLKYNNNEIRDRSYSNLF